MEDFIYYSTVNFLKNTIYRDKFISSITSFSYSDETENFYHILSTLSKKMFVFYPLDEIMAKFHRFVKCRNRSEKRQVPLNSPLFSYLIKYKERFSFEEYERVRDEILDSVNKQEVDPYPVDLPKKFNAFVPYVESVKVSTVETYSIFINMILEMVPYLLLDENYIFLMINQALRQLKVGIADKIVVPEIVEDCRTQEDIIFLMKVRTLNSLVLRCILYLFYDPNLEVEVMIKTHPLFSGVVYESYKVEAIDSSFFSLLVLELQKNLSFLFEKYGTGITLDTSKESEEEKVKTEIEEETEDQVQTPASNLDFLSQLMKDLKTSKESTTPLITTEKKEEVQITNQPDTILLEAISNMQQQLTNIQLKMRNITNEGTSLENYKIIQDEYGNLSLIDKDSEKLIPPKERDLLMVKNSTSSEYLNGLMKKSYSEIIRTGKNFVGYYDNLKRDHISQILSMSTKEVNLGNIIYILKVILETFKGELLKLTNDKLAKNDKVYTSKILKTCYITNLNILPNISQLRVVYNLMNTPEISKESMSKAIEISNSLLETSNKLIILALG